MKVDPYNHKGIYLNWKEKTENGISGISKENSDLIKQYLGDMEVGLNVANGSKRGARSYIRLNTLRDRLCFFSRHFESRFELDSIAEITEEQLLHFFNDMETGVIVKKNGAKYMSIDYYAKVFKAFWNWYIKVKNKDGIEVQDIGKYLNTKAKKPKWVYLTEEEVRKLCNNAKYEYRVLMMFLLDSGIRSPTELVNIRISDLYEDCKKLQIREEISKTFGRKINLILSSNLIKEYIDEKRLRGEDVLFPIKPSTVNKYLKRLAKNVLGEGKTLAGAYYPELTMYDFRHSSACYWLPRYKSESALKYRFGWKKSEMIYYYTELLGMKDTITEDDILLDISRTELEKRLSKTERDKQILQEKVENLEQQMKKILKLTDQICVKVMN